MSRGKIRELPSLDTLNRVFRYEPESGKLFWKIKPNGRVALGAEIANKAGRFNGKTKATQFTVLHGLCTINNYQM